MLLLWIIAWGMLAGYLAHLIVERDRPPDWGLLLGAGFGGSLIGGLVVSLLSGDGISFRFSGIIGSVLGAVVILAIVGSMRRKQAAERKAAQKQQHKGRTTPKAKKR